jgi:hypothetical protein
MFVRFRQGHRLQVSLVETRRVDGKVRHEHVAGLGTIDVPPSVADRVEFWRRLHERLGQLSNRLDTAAQGKILGEIHARVPMVTVEELRAVQLENAEADERFWAGLRDMQAEQAEGNKRLAAQAERAAAKADTEALKARTRAEAAKDGAERLKRGEAVSGGLGRQLTLEDMERICRDAGWTTKDIERAHMVAELSELGGFEELLDEVQKRHRRAEFATVRAVLRRRLSLSGGGR